MIRFLIFIFVFLSALTIIKPQQFGFRVDKGIIQSDKIIEASGIVASRKNLGVFWTHNDSGDKSRIFAFDSLGNNLGSFLLAGVQNRDWEDMCIGQKDSTGKHYIYIGDIGDNSLRYHTKYIYRIIEPDVSKSQIPVDSVLYGVERLAFQYPDGKKNAETLLIDPFTSNIYIVSKEKNTKVYSLTSPYKFYNTPPLSIDTLEQIAELPFSTAVGGDISPDGKEILIKRKNVIYYWVRKKNETIADVLNKVPITVPYFKEPQGEAVCWASDLSGYYTISEGAHPHLYFYPRLVTSVKYKNNLSNKFELYQNYPNPFNPATTIKYSISSLHAMSQQIELKIYDILGKEISTLVNKKQNPGNYQVQWDGKNNDGIKVSNGVYLYRLKAGSFVTTKKMIFLQ